MIVLSNLCFLSTQFIPIADVQCSHRYGKVLKPGIQKGAWREDEDAILCSEVIRWGDSKVKWSLIAEKLQGANIILEHFHQLVHLKYVLNVWLGRLGKQCRERWFNHLDPNINRGKCTYLVIDNLQHFMDLAI